MLDDLIEGWLSVPAHRLALRFPPALETRFEADTGAERCRSLMIAGVIGVLVATMLYPVLCTGVPDLAGQVRTLYLFTAMPVLLLAALSMSFQPPCMIRESVVLLANLLCASITLYLYAESSMASPALFVAAVAVMLVYNSLGIQLRFSFALIAKVFIICAFALALHVRGETSEKEQFGEIAVSAATAAYLMLASFRLERASRRDYLLMLRERLQRQVLSRRNIELDELSRRDALTGLANRRAYDAWMETAWSQEGGGERSGFGRLGLIVIDVDRFKAYNDFYGHAAGDSCLKNIAICLREQLRGTTDLVARMGGEEFAVLLPGLPEHLCADVAERMRLAVQQLELPHSGLGPHGLVTVSAGVASHPCLPVYSPASLFEAADGALYQAKMAGRNQVCVSTTPSLLETSCALPDFHGRPPRSDQLAS